MSTSKYIDRICMITLSVTMVIAFLFMNGAAQGVQASSRILTYEDRLFDVSKVHKIDIVMDNWEDFIETCENEEYVLADVVIDGEVYKNVGIRAKGNTSLRNVSSMGSDRYSFKIEFDQYTDTGNYYGLDKLVLNNLIQDNTMMKDYLTYRMMGQFGVASPLCSYAYITVNGKDWGLYLAVEGVEEGFLRRNYGSSDGKLYKPEDEKSRGGGENGQSREEERGWSGERGGEENGQSREGENGWNGERGGGGNGQSREEGNGWNGEREDGGQPPEGFGAPPAGGPENMGDRKPGGGFGGIGSGAIKLQYVDEDPDSYEEIFSSAKMDITAADQARLIASLQALSAGEKIEDVVDVDQVIRYFVVHNFVVNGDSYTGNIVHNYYLYEKDGRLTMLPWDYNLAFGTFQNSSASDAVNDPIDTPLSSGEGDRPMLDWIFGDEEYTALYHQYFEEFLDTVDITAMIDETAELIAPYVEKDPSKFCTFEEFETGVETIRTFCLLRAESVRGQLDGSISSKSSGQDSADGLLVDASAIDLSDMGSMENGGGAHGFRKK